MTLPDAVRQHDKRIWAKSGQATLGRRYRAVAAPFQAKHKESLQMKKREGYRFYLATALSMIFILLPIGGVDGSTAIRQNHKSMLPSINVSIDNAPPKLANSSPLQ